MKTDPPGGERGQAGPSPASLPASAPLSYACSDSSQPAFSPPGRESCSPTEAHPTAPTLRLLLPHHPHTPCHGEREERKGAAAEPRRWDHWPSLSRHALGHALAPASRPRQQHRKLLTPLDNAQHRPHFHKYKASGVQWGRGADRSGGRPPTPSTLPPEPTSLCFPPALKIALAARLMGSPSNKLLDWEFCQVFRGIWIGTPSSSS